MVLDQGGAVSDADEGDARFLEQLVEAFLIVFIQCAGGLVKEGKTGIAQKQSRESHALLFTHRQDVGPVEHAFQIAVDAIQHVREIHLIGHRDDLFVAEQRRRPIE